MVTGLKPGVNEKAAAFKLNQYKVLVQKGYGRSSWQADLILLYGRGTASIAPVLGFIHSECAAPSRFR